MMPLLRRAAIVLAGCALVAAPAHAWQITRFESAITVLRDGQLDVTETIDADFDGPRHGLYRDLPIDYLDRIGQRLRLRVRVLDVEVNDAPAHYRATRQGRMLRIRIGDANRYVDGRQIYVVRYRVGRALNDFPDHDELYWNVTGNEWAVPIATAAATVTLPDTIDLSSVRTAVYTGAYGSRASDARVTQYEHVLGFTTGGSLPPYDGLTIVVGWPPGMVRPPSVPQRVAWWLQDNWPYGLPMLAFVVMLWLWNRRGREFSGRQSIVVRYEPPDGLPPAEVGALIDDSVDLRDVTAIIIDLAVRGYLRIEPEGRTLFGSPNDYRFERLKPFAADSTLRPYERSVLHGLFGDAQTTRSLSELENSFYEELPAISDDIFNALIRSGHLDSAPDTVRHHYLVAAGLVAAVIIIPLHQSAPFTAIFSGLAAAAIIAAFGHFMPRKTLKGRLALDDIRGFEEFLSRTDRDRLARLDPRELFERFLPHALALGVAAQWAAAFEGLYTQPPAWYGGSFDHGFSTRVFVSNLQHSTNAMARTFQSSPRTAASSGSSGFGGGGFSGGGFGGGGGGSW